MLKLMENYFCGTMYFKLWSAIFVQWPVMTDKLFSAQVKYGGTANKMEVSFSADVKQMHSKTFFGDGSPERIHLPLMSPKAGESSNNFNSTSKKEKTFDKNRPSAVVILPEN